MESPASSVAMDHDACGVGFIADLTCRRSHDIVERALTALLRLSHRGGLDSDGRSGDGAGLLTAIPDEFLRRCAHDIGIELPPMFGVGMVFLTPGCEHQERMLVETLASRVGLTCLGWRSVPVDLSVAGGRAADTVPTIEQCFFATAAGVTDLEQPLFALRKRVESTPEASLYFCSLSSRTIVYKGLLTPEQ